MLFEVRLQHRRMAIGEHAVAGFLDRTAQAPRVVQGDVESCHGKPVDIRPFAEERQEAVRVLFDACLRLTAKVLQYLATNAQIESVRLQPLKGLRLAVLGPGVDQALRRAFRQHAGQCCRISCIQNRIQALPESLPQPTSFYRAEALERWAIGDIFNDVLAGWHREVRGSGFHLLFSQLKAVDDNAPLRHRAADPPPLAAFDARRT